MTCVEYLLQNEGNGRFRDAALEAGVAYPEDGKALSSMGADFRDYDNDGREISSSRALRRDLPSFPQCGRRAFCGSDHGKRLARQTMPYTGWSAGISILTTTRARLSTSRCRGSPGPGRGAPDADPPHARRRPPGRPRRAARGVRRRRGLRGRRRGGGRRGGARAGRPLEVDVVLLDLRMPGWTA